MTTFSDMPGVIVMPDVLPVVIHVSLDLQVTISDDSINFYTGTLQKREARRYRIC